ncbi:MAG: phosphoribosylformylglycinamidine synthase subunit PurS [Chloroflexi bacterium]|nr:phosphoribosylformylglycinamidine synthase subunit PurS [Chloroflexota bacterium]
MLRPSVNDPPGQSIRGGLHALGFGEVTSVRAGKLLLVRLTAPDRPTAEARVDRMCAQLLANPVIEHYQVTLRPAEKDADAPD